MLRMYRTAYENCTSLKKVRTCDHYICSNMVINMYERKHEANKKAQIYVYAERVSV